MDLSHKIKIKNLLFRLLTVIVSTALLYLCFRQVNVTNLWGEIKNIRISFFLTGAIVFFFIIVLKSLQIRVYLPASKKIPIGKIIRAVSILLMTVSLVPFWGGHAFFVYLLGHKEKIGKTLILSIVTMDQVIEGFGKLALFAVVALVTPLPDWMKSGMLWLTGVVLLVYSSFFILATRYRNHGERQIKPLSSKILDKIYRTFIGLATQLKVIRDVRVISMTLLLSILMKGFEILAVLMVQKSFGVELPYYSPLLVVAALSLGTVLPLAPGRLGIFEATIFITYRYLNLEATQAMTLAIFIHMVHTLPFVVSGYLASLKLGLSRKQLQIDSENSLVLQSPT